MRILLAMLAALTLTQCASSEDERFRVGASPRSFVIIGVAEAAANTQPYYVMLWRRLDQGGAFTEYEERNIFEPRTNARGSARVRGIPGEFIAAEIDPGVYALDSVFALLRDRRVNYVANGVVRGPERPAFEVRPGEAVYLGIWEMNLVDAAPVTRLWRMDQADARAAQRATRAVVGELRMRATHIRAAPCSPHQPSSLSQRQVC
jgi:hypothetical protein